MNKFIFIVLNCNKNGLHYLQVFIVLYINNRCDLAKNKQLCSQISNIYMIGSNLDKRSSLNTIKNHACQCSYCRPISSDLIVEVGTSNFALQKAGRLLYVSVYCLVIY